MIARIDALYILLCLKDLFNLGMGFRDNLELIGNYVILRFLLLAESAAHEWQNKKFSPSSPLPHCPSSPSFSSGFFFPFPLNLFPHLFFFFFPFCLSLLLIICLFWHTLWVLLDHGGFIQTKPLDLLMHH
jgi:hypothetical protein